MANGKPSMKAALLSVIANRSLRRTATESLGMRRIGNSKNKQNLGQNIAYGGAFQLWFI